MIDRQARDKLATALRAYMDERITAFELDDAVGRVTEATVDETVRDVGAALWFCYDDRKDHKIVASKAQWDWLCRLLLLLESDAQIRVVRAGRRWHLRQVFAAACLAAFGVLAFQTGFGSHLLILAVPFGVISMALHRWILFETNGRHTDEAVMTPFPSLAGLFSGRRHVTGFCKRRYPSSPAVRRIHGRLYEMALRLPWWAAWLMLAPLPLFFQMLPEVVSETEITLPEPTVPAAG